MYISYQQLRKYLAKVAAGATAVGYYDNVVPAANDPCLVNGGLGLQPELPHLPKFDAQSEIRKK